jgi:cell division septation protein DedD
MSQPFTIQLSRRRVIALTACLIGAAVLLFIAGTATGLLVASQATVGDAIAPKQLNAEKTVLPPSQPKPSQQASKADASQQPDTAPDAAETALPDAQPGDGPPVETHLPQPQSAPAPAPASDATGAVDPAAASSRPTAGSASNPHPASPASSPQTAEESDGVPLAVKVCSFSSKAAADKMIASLAEHGYQASLTHSIGADGRAWYVVKLGPYREWDAASTVAAKVAIAENVRPMVGPLR